MKRLSLIGFVLLLAGCGVFEPVPESYKNRIADNDHDNDHDTTLIITPSTWFGPATTDEDFIVPIAEPVGPVTEIVTTDMVKYVNTVTGETSYGPSYGGYLANHPDWQQAHLDGVL